MNQGIDFTIAEHRIRVRIRAAYVLFIEFGPRRFLLRSGRGGGAGSIRAHVQSAARRPPRSPEQPELHISPWRRGGAAGAPTGTFRCMRASGQSAGVFSIIGMLITYHDHNLNIFKWGVVVGTQSASRWSMQGVPVAGSQHGVLGSGSAHRHYRLLRALPGSGKREACMGVFQMKCVRNPRRMHVGCAYACRECMRTLKCT